MIAGDGRRGLDDASLAEEIELYGELVIAASDSTGPLTQDSIDRVLGLADAPTDHEGSDGRH